MSSYQDNHFSKNRSFGPHAVFVPILLIKELCSFDDLSVISRVRYCDGVLLSPAILQDKGDGGIDQETYRDVRLESNFLARRGITATLLTSAAKQKENRPAAASQIREMRRCITTSILFDTDLRNKNFQSNNSSNFSN